MDSFKAYKQSTNIALFWLGSAIKHAGTSANHAFRSTSHIVAAAQTISEAQTPVPRYVIEALRDAIKHRWLVYRSFTSSTSKIEDSETKARDERHRAFIIRLQQSLDLLLPNEDKTHGKKKQVIPPDAQNVTYEYAANRFLSLSTVEAEVMPSSTHAATDADDADTEYGSETTTMNFGARFPLSMEEMVLEDDEFGEYYALSMVMNELDTLIETTNTYWLESAQGLMPLPVAAWLTSTVLHAVGRMSGRYSHIAPDSDALREKWFKQRQLWPFRLRFRDIPHLSLNEGPCWNGVPSWIFALMIHNCRTEEEYKQIVPTAGSRQEPRDYIPVHSTLASDPSPYDNAMDKMQESMRLGFTKERGISHVEPAQELRFSCEPLLPILHATLEKTDKPVPFNLVFGYQMLLSSYETYLWSKEMAGSPNCRRSALRLAMRVKQEIKKAADPVFFRFGGCGGILETSRRYIESASTRLDAFIMEVRFDLYYQAPWTSGSHMIEIIVFAMYEGLNLCLISGIVGPLLHLYNAARHASAVVPHVKLLDDLCEVFRKDVFLDTLPRTNFLSHFRRAMGGELAPSGVGGSRHTRIAYPTKGRFKGTIRRGFSLFYDLQNNGYGPTRPMWVKAYLGKSTNEYTSKDERDVAEQVHSVPFNVPLNKLRDAVMLEFNGPLPVARLNYFAVHSFCSSLLHKIEQRVYAEGSSDAIMMVDGLLAATMDHLNDARKRRMLKYWAPLKLIGQCISELDGKSSLEDLTWQI